MRYIVSIKTLEKLKEAACKNPEGLSNYILVCNSDREKGDFVFRVVCERVKEAKP